MGPPSLSQPRSELSDRQLLLLAERDPEAFGEFYRRHCSAVLRYFVGRTDCAETAAELTAETFAQAWSARRTFRGEGSGRAWLFGIARHLLYRWFRRQRIDARARRRLGMPPVELGETSMERIEELAVRERAHQRVQEALESLSPRLREAVQLRICDQLSYPEMARRLGCTVGAARVRVTRGLARLEAKFETELTE